jgi:hypothetical protein
MERKCGLQFNLYIIPNTGILVGTKEEKTFKPPTPRENQVDKERIIFWLFEF